MSNIRHYDQLLEKYASEAEIIEEAEQKQKADILEKARAGKSRYLTYVKVNPNLERSKIYERNVSTSKLQKVIRLRTNSHSLEIETGRHGRHRKTIEEP